MAKRRGKGFSSPEQRKAVMALLWERKKRRLAKTLGVSKQEFGGLRGFKYTPGHRYIPYGGESVRSEKTLGVYSVRPKRIELYREPHKQLVGYDPVDTARHELGHHVTYRMRLGQRHKAAALGLGVHPAALGGVMDTDDLDEFLANIYALHRGRRPGSQLSWVDKRQRAAVALMLREMRKRNRRG